MKKICTSDLRELEVINLCGGEKLGYPCDFEIDLDSQRLLSVKVRDGAEIPFIKKCEEYIIPWCNIECIGEDAILVKIPQNEISSFCCSEKRRKNSKK